MKRFFPALNQPTQIGETEEASTSVESDELTPSKQAKKFDESSPSLEENLTQTLNCVICLDLSNGEVFQCRNGHLMCECCYVRLHAESCIRKQQTRCPLCRIFIMRKSAIRSLCAERAAALLLTNCPQCSLTLMRADLAEHQAVLCPASLTPCIYRDIGCMWSGPLIQRQEHEHRCEQSRQPAKALLPTIFELQSSTQAMIEPFGQLLESLNECRFCFQDLSTTHYDFNNLVHAAYYTTDKFRAWDLSWSIKLKFVHPEYIIEDDAGGAGGYYQVVLRSRPDRNICAKFFLLSNANTGVQLPLTLHEYEFSAHDLESDFKVLSLASSLDTYRFLAKTKIKFRYVMIVVP